MTDKFVHPLLNLLNILDDPGFLRFDSLFIRGLLINLSRRLWIGVRVIVWAGRIMLLMLNTLLTVLEDLMFI
jgi:hypothetical protein